MIYSESAINHCKLLTESFYSLTGSRLLEAKLDGMELVEKMYTAPFVVVSHGTETDPIFNFANLKAQELWEMSWDEFVKMPSRLSAEKISQDERQRLLERAMTFGFISDYRGVRISKSGKRFRILNTTLWNLIDSGKTYKGQAAMFGEWEFL